MSDVEHRVRDLLQRHAGAAPTAPALITAVRTESRRRARRTRVLVAAVVIALAGAGVTVPLRLAAGPVAVAAPSTLTEPASLARSLSAVPVTAPAPFGFALVPSGYTVDNISSAAVTRHPPPAFMIESRVTLLPRFTRVPAFIW